MSKKKKLSAVERIAISLDRIDGSMAVMAQAYETIATCARKQVGISEEHLGVAKDSLAVTIAMVQGVSANKAPWWRKLFSRK